MNRKEKFSAILNEIRDGKTAKIEFEAAGRRYIRRFIPEERLILLGGGHISVPLCKIAAILGFSVVERRIVSGTDDGLFSGDPVSLATHSDRGDMYFAA